MDRVAEDIQSSDSSGLQAGVPVYISGSKLLGTHISRLGKRQLDASVHGLWLAHWSACLGHHRMIVRVCLHVLRHFYYTPPRKREGAPL